MIIIKIIGGLGNQLFQYASAKAIALRSGTVLKLDTSDFATYEPHNYSLQHFNINEDIATPEEINQYKKYPIFIERQPEAVKKIIKKLKLDQALLAFGRYIKDDAFVYNPKLHVIKDGAYLDGYFASEKYFVDIRDVLKKEFTLKVNLGKEGKEIADQIKLLENPVCLHIRRGDFANNPVQSKFHGICPIEYYHEAVKIIASKATNPHFFIFSDSIEWVKENFKIDYPMTFIGQGASKNYEDITLMSLCKHHILSNSTFGWWGAWLAERKNQTVVAPKKWFNKPIDIKDLMPDWWIKI